MDMTRAFTPPEHCPVCGEPVPRGARACPGCGADERTGWNEEASAGDGLDLPDGDFDRGKFLETEFGTPRPRTAREKIWVGVVLLLVAAVTLLLVLRNFLPHG
jgi:hypothetical protein